MQVRHARSHAMPSVHDRFTLVSDFEIRGDQVRAIPELVEGLNRGDAHQVLLGVTGSGKTFTMAQVVATVNRPTLVMAHNKTLAAQLYQEFKRFFPGQRRRVLRQLLRLLPARGLRPGDRLVHREGSDDQRRDRPDAAVGHAVALRAPRRHHRRQRVVHLRPRLARGVLRDAAAARGRASASTAIRSCASWSRSSTSATTPSSAAARSASAATSSRSCPSYEEHALRIGLFGDEVDELAWFDPLTGKVIKRLDKIAVYPKSHFVTSRDRTKQAVEIDQAGARVVSRPARVGRQAARSAAAAPADDVRPRDDPRDRLLPRHRELLAPPDRPARPASRRRRCSTTCRTTRW